MVATAQRALNTLNVQFDVLFLDPPYALDLWQELAVLAEPLLADNAYIYVEADRDLALLKLPDTWQQIKHTKAGVVQAALYQKITTSH